MEIRPWFSNIRFYVLASSIILAASIYFWVKVTVSDSGLQIIKLTQIYALTAVTYLYFTLLASPLTRFFTFLPYRGQYLKARRAIGVSTFLFGLLHGSFAFFGELGGFSGLGFLSAKYLLALGFSTTALIIFSLMAATASEYMVAKLSYPKWKILHRFIYLASFLVIVHALMLGSHFQDLSGLIPRIGFVALTILLILEVVRFKNYLQVKFKK